MNQPIQYFPWMDIPSDTLTRWALRAIQWINLNRHFLEFTTLPKASPDRIMAGQNQKPVGKSNNAVRTVGIQGGQPAPSE